MIEYGKWWKETEAVLSQKSASADVPCGTCTACCRSSQFIHVRPDESETLARIPKGLLFPAPGAPKGHLLMGFGKDGACPMLVDDRCSIYDARPQTCRKYDCRIFPATGLALEAEAQADIAEAAKRWTFSFADQTSRARYDATQMAGDFLKSRRDLFPEGRLPTHPAQLAVLALTVSDLFPSELADAEIAALILQKVPKTGTSQP